MDAITIKIPSDLREEIEAYAAENHDENRSAAVRVLLERGLDYDNLESERDRLQRKLAATNAREEDVTDLIEYVESEREIQRRRERRREERRRAPLWRRAKWYVFGHGTDSEGTEA